jgi:hypothetical protein
MMVYIYDWRSFQDFVAGHADNTTDISGTCASTSQSQPITRKALSIIRVAADESGKEKNKYTE